MKNLVIALLLGIILGAAGYWLILQPPVQEAAQRAEQKAADVGKAVSGAGDEAKRAVADKLAADPELSAFTVSVNTTGGREVVSTLQVK